MNAPDALVIGAGFSGAVMAERMASQLGWKVWVIDQRQHIGGNCHDHLDPHGIRVHDYGPHLFHTDRDDVWQYLSQFTQWQPYEHRVLSNIDDQLVPIPFNLTSIRRCFPPEQAEKMLSRLRERFGDGARIPILTLRQEPDPVLQVLAAFIYDKAFVNYTAKQWGVPPEAISPEVTARVPVVVSEDDRYFTDPYQALPRDGYTALFERLLDHPNITVKLGTPLSEVLTLDWEQLRMQLVGEHTAYTGTVVYTGMIDQLFAADLGALPYRSLRFEFVSQAVPWWQPATTVNYPNDEDFTRITEFKHLMAPAPDGHHTTVVYEYPKAFNPSDGDEPYYPVFTETSKQHFARYQQRAAQMDGLICLGRLAQYRYFDMDDAVANALDCFAVMKEKYGG